MPSSAKEIIMSDNKLRFINGRLIDTISLITGKGERVTKKDMEAVKILMEVVQHFDEIISTNNQNLQDKDN